MTKVKIVQIAVSSGDDWPDQYLDDKGRIWVQRAVFEKIGDKNDGSKIIKRFSHYEWGQIELPEEPEL